MGHLMDVMILMDGYRGSTARGNPLSKILATPLHISHVCKQMSYYLYLIRILSSSTATITNSQDVNGYSNCVFPVLCFACMGFVTEYLDPHDIWTPGPNISEIFGPPLK